MTGGCGGGIPSCEQVFDRRTAEADLRGLRKDGPPWATRALVEALADGLDLAGTTVVDIGAGIGAVHLALLERGADHAVDVDGSTAYVDLAREEAARRGLTERVRHVLGDVTERGPEVEPADLVALDRVVCCYGDLGALLRTATSLANVRLGLVYPRDDWWVRAVITAANPVMFRRSGGYRMRIHRAREIGGRLQDAGFRRRSLRAGRIWRVECWERIAATPAAGD